MPPIFAEMVRGEGLDSRVFGCYVQNFANIVTDYQFDRHGYVPGNEYAYSAPSGILLLPPRFAEIRQARYRANQAVGDSYESE